MPDFQKLPDHIRHLPEVVDVRLTRLENVVSERRNLMDHEVHTPAGKIPLPVFIILISAALYLKPELVSSLFGR